MASITYPTKSTGDTFSAAEANEVKTVVNGKSDSDHTHIISNVTGLQDALDLKLATTGLVAALNAAVGQDSNAVLDGSADLIADITAITTGEFLTKGASGADVTGTGTAVISGEDLLKLTAILANYVRATTTGPTSMDFLEDADTGTSHVRIIAPSALAANVTVTLPSASVTLPTLGTASDIWAGTAADKFLPPSVWLTALAPTAVADGATITLSLNAGVNFEVAALGGNRTLAFSNYTGKGGRSGWIRVVQDGTGSRTLTPGTDVEPVGGGTIVLNGTASQVTVLPYAVTSGNKVMIG